MYLVDNVLYNKLSLNTNLNIDKESLSRTQNIAIKPNINIHNKHAPSSYLTYPDPRPQPPTPLAQPPYAPPPAPPPPLPAQPLYPPPPAPTLAPTPLSQFPQAPAPTYHNILTNSNIYNNLEEPNTSSTIPKMDVIYMDYDNLAKIDNANSNMDNNNLQESNASKIEDWEKKEHEWIENVQSDLNHAQPALPQREYTHTRTTTISTTFSITSFTTYTTTDRVHTHTTTFSITSFTTCTTTDRVHTTTFSITSCTTYTTTDRVHTHTTTFSTTTTIQYTYALRI